MKSNEAPQKQATPFGANGPREPITPTTPSGSNQASYDQGFPPITMTLKSAGGLPPKGQDMNQILFEQSSFNRFFAAGGEYQYDAAFSAAISGYPAGARIPNSTNSGFWLNTVEDNQTNPENTTAAITGWVPVSSYGTTSISGLSSSSVTLTTLQASKERITLAGTLTANINIVVPAWIKRWEVINNCTGAFTVTIKTPTGTGVTVASGATAIVQGDGTNIVRATAPGTLVNTQYLTSTGTYIKTPGTKNVRVRGVGGGGAGGGVGASQSTTVRGGGGGAAGTYGELWITNVPDTVSVTIGAAGSGINGGDGVAGGTTSFGVLLILPGGNGGVLGVQATTAGARSGVGGDFAANGTGANLTVRGMRGGDSVASTNTIVITSSGASSPLGSGPTTYIAGSSTNSAFTFQGFPALGYGSGGGGAACGLGGGGSAGGNGSPGILIVEEYA